MQSAHQEHEEKAKEPASSVHKAARPHKRSKRKQADRARHLEGDRAIRPTEDR